METGIITDGILDMCGAFAKYGYVVTASPLPNEEATFESCLRDGFRQMEGNFAALAKSYRTRGLSKRALDILHSRYPTPVWGVEVA